MSAMGDSEILPEILEGHRQMDSTELLQPGDLIFCQYLEAWVKIPGNSPSIANSAGNCSITIRRADRAADPEVLALRRATSKTHG